MLFQVPLALFFGFVCPPMIGHFWGDALGAFVWGGLVARLFSRRINFINTIDSVQLFFSYQFGTVHSWSIRSCLLCLSLCDGFDDAIKYQSSSLGWFATIF